MAGFIEEFYYGKIDPQARGAKPNTTVKKEMQILTDYEEELTKLLTGEEKKKFLSYVNAWGVVNGEGTRGGGEKSLPLFQCSGHGTKSNL